MLPQPAPNFHRAASFWLAVALSVFDTVYAFLPVAKDAITPSQFMWANLALGLAIMLARAIKQHFPDPEV